jgi:hypothetical protein
MKRILIFALSCALLLTTASVAFTQDTTACDGDIARFCSNIQPGQGLIADCLKQNEAQLSPACKQKNLAALAEAIRQTQRACEVDSVKFCGSELQQPGGGRLLNCLKLNASQLSPDCRSKVFEVLEGVY